MDRPYPNDAVDMDTSLNKTEESSSGNQKQQQQQQPIRKSTFEPTEQHKPSTLSSAAESNKIAVNNSASDKEPNAGTVSDASNAKTTSATNPKTVSNTTSGVSGPEPPSVATNVADVADASPSKQDVATPPVTLAPQFVHNLLSVHTTVAAAAANKKYASSDGKKNKYTTVSAEAAVTSGSSITKRNHEIDEEKRNHIIIEIDETEYQHNKRRMEYMIEKSGTVTPSFTAILNVDYDASITDDTFAAQVDTELQQQRPRYDELLQLHKDRMKKEEERAMKLNSYKQRHNSVDTLPKRVKIEVDAALGFKGKDAPIIIPILDDDDDDYDDDGNISQPPPPKKRRYSMNPQKVAPSSTANLSSSDVYFANKNASTNDFVDSSTVFYDGIISPLTLPEDDAHLSIPQRFARKHLELFTAGIEYSIGSDGSAPSSAKVGGRHKQRIVYQRVGIRCRYCIGSCRPADEAPSKSMPAGALSWPMNVAGMHNICGSKLQIHFTKCKYLPEQHRDELNQILNLGHKGSSNTGENTADNIGSSSAIDSSTATASAVKSGSSKSGRTIGGMSNVTYYTIVAHRIGLVDAPNDGGLRFCRDVTSEPLPFEPSRQHIKQQLQLKQELLQQQEGNDTDSSVDGGSTGDAKATSDSDVIRPDKIVRSSDWSNSKVCDEASKRVLSQALEAVNYKPGAVDCSVTKKSDKKMLTDYMFLLCCQMEFCHVPEADLVRRGKKSKSMRIGLTGVCCRWCRTSQSYSSNTEGLGCAIPNSFASHVRRCENMPVSVLHALDGCRSLHPLQMHTLLRHGSQRKFMVELWDRIRSLDKTEEEMKTYECPPLIPIAMAPKSSSSHTTITARNSFNTQSNASSEIVLIATDDEDSITSDIEIDDYVRPERFPTVDEPEVITILANAVASHNPKSELRMMGPKDRRLISDFVFLILTQLKYAVPSVVLVGRGKRLPPMVGQYALPGLACSHCSDEGRMALSSGRSFPSAPDNIASCLNSSIYNHMQTCPYVPDDVRRALFALRQIHSQQISALAFGGQRRFFRILFSRLKRRAEQIATTDAAKNNPLNPMSIEDVLEKSHYKSLPQQTAESNVDALAQCTKCRMVPYPFRFSGSIVRVRSRIAAAQVQKHCNGCTETSFHYACLTAALEKAIRTDFMGNKTVVLEQNEGTMNTLFKAVIQEALGGGVANMDLTNAIIQGITNVLTTAAPRSGSTSSDETVSEDTTPMDVSLENSSKSHPLPLWNAFASDVALGAVATAFTKLMDSYTGTATTFSNNIMEFPSVLDFLLLMSPSLQTTLKDNV